MARGSLRIYLGAAPGVGKTVAMLDEAHAPLERGTDVVVGYVETHGRPHTAAHDRGPRGRSAPRGRLPRHGSTELDVDAVLARIPRSCWSTSSPTPTSPRQSRHEKRWQDVEEILEAGIDVISTVNIQHLESLNDVVESITGVRQQETVPDEVVRRADQVEVVDMSPEALRRRMAHGNIYAARQGRRRPGELLPGRQPLGAARDRAAVARRPGRRGARALPADQGISDQWPTRERVVVALTGAPAARRCSGAAPASPPGRPVATSSPATSSRPRA